MSAHPILQTQHLMASWLRAAQSLAGPWAAPWASLWPAGLAERQIEAAAAFQTQAMRAWTGAWLADAGRAKPVETTAEAPSAPEMPSAVPTAGAPPAEMVALADAPVETEAKAFESVETPPEPAPAPAPVAPVVPRKRPKAAVELRASVPQRKSHLPVARRARAAKAKGATRH